MKKTILAYGEVLWDLLPTGPKLGGAPFNFAYRIHSLGDRGVMVSRLGTDDLGNEAWLRVEALGMDTRCIQRDEEKPSGTVHITLRDKKPDYFIVPDAAYDYIAMTREMFDVAPMCDCICFGTLAQRSAVSRRTLERFLDASGNAMNLLDINLRKACFTQEIVIASLERATILRLNEEEARFLCDFLRLPCRTLAGFCDAVQRKYHLELCLITLGERGALAALFGGEKVYVPGYRVEVTDPCGCGDAFTAGFLHRWLRNGSLLECAELGNALGAMVATQPGATEAVTSEDIQRLLRQDHERIIEPELRSFIPT